MRQNLLPRKTIGIGLISGFLIIGFSFPSLAQQSPETDVSEYFEKGSQWKPEIIAKFNIASLVIGDLGLTVEHLIKDMISFEAGVSLLLPYFREPFPAWMETAGLLEREMGIGLMGQIRFYPDGYNWDGLYYGLQYAFKNFSAYQSTINQHSYSAICGYQFHLTKRIIGDVGAGIGVRKINASNAHLYVRDKPSFENGFIMQLNLKVGYFFN